MLKARRDLNEKKKKKGKEILRTLCSGLHVASRRDFVVSFSDFYFNYLLSVSEYVPSVYSWLQASSNINFTIQSVILTRLRWLLQNPRTIFGLLSSMSYKWARSVFELQSVSRSIQGWNQKTQEKVNWVARLRRSGPRI